MAKLKLSLNEAEIKEAVAEWVEKHKGIKGAVSVRAREEWIGQGAMEQKTHVVEIFVLSNE